MDYKKMFPPVDTPVSSDEKKPNPAPVVDAPQPAASSQQSFKYAGMFPGANPDSGYSELSLEQTAKDLGLPLAAGAALGYWSTGAGRTPMKPNPNVVAKSFTTPFAETMYGARPGSVAQTIEAMQPKVSTSAADAARAVAESNVAPVAPAAPTPKTTPLIDENSSGAKWLENWAKQNAEGFTGGVPEAAGKYERGKYHGKISSKIKKMFPHGLTGAGSAVAEDEILNRVRQELWASEVAKKEAARVAAQNAAREAQVLQAAKATESASKLAAPLTVAGRVAGGAGIGAGLYDAYQHYMNQDKTGAGLAAGLTGLSAMFPGYGPLSAAAMQLYDDPEARKKFLEGLSGQSPYANRTGRLGLD